MKKKSPLSAIPTSSRPKKAHMKSTDITFYNFSVSGAATGNGCVVGLGANGVVFVPVAVFPDEGRDAIRRAVAEDVAGGNHDGHAFLPAEWVKAQLADFPDRIQIVDNMVSAIRNMSL